MSNIMSFLIENPLYISLAIFAVCVIALIQSDLGKEQLEKNLKRGIEPKTNRF